MAIKYLKKGSTSLATTEINASQREWMPESGKLEKTHSSLSVLSLGYSGESQEELVKTAGSPALSDLFLPSLQGPLLFFKAEQVGWDQIVEAVECQG